VLRAIRDEHLELVASWELAEELLEVLLRPKLRRYGLTEQDVEDVLVLMAPFLPTVEVKVELRGPEDALVVAAALAGGADAIVTGDRDLLEDDALRLWLSERDVEVLTPAQLLERLEPTQ
jgi:putative PIN family toxin of toxin-antitoxin system